MLLRDRERLAHVVRERPREIASLDLLGQRPFDLRRAPHLRPRGQVVAADHPQQLRQALLSEQVEVALAARPHARAHGERRLAPLRDHPGVRVREQVELPPVLAPRLRLVDRQVDVIARAGRLGPQHAEHDGERRDQPRLPLGVVAGQPQRRALRVPGAVHRAAHRLQHEVARPEPRVRPVLPEGRDRADDQPRPRATRRIQVDAEQREPPGRQVLDHRVAPLDQRAHERDSLGAREVRDDAALARVQPEKRRARLGIGNVAAEGSLVARRVAARGLDLRHERPVVGEQLRRVRAGDPRGEVEHAQAFERAGRRRRPPRGRGGHAGLRRL